MSFLFPSFLWALFALSIPVIIHLFYFRRYRTVYFTNVSFLKELKEEKSTRNRLKHLLVLLLRLLLIACLVIAFAQPFLKGKNNADSGRQTVSIYLDNSFSMMAQDDEMPLLEKSRQLATEIVKAYPAGTQFHYITNDM